MMQLQLGIGVRYEPYADCSSKCNILASCSTFSVGIMRNNRYCSWMQQVSLSVRSVKNRYQVHDSGTSGSMFGFLLLRCCSSDIITMGCVTSRTNEESRKLDRQLTKDGEKEGQILKLLLLGSGESGKSTIMKQVKILHQRGFSQEELRAAAPVVYQNVISSMTCILEAMSNFQIPFSDPSNTGNANTIAYTSTSSSDFMMPEERGKLLMAMDKLWADEGVRKCYARSNEFQLQESADYFFARLPRIFSQDYVPTTEDVLKVRVRTTGVIESPFQVKYRGMTLNFKLIDVGGQRSERRKWIHCFENVSAIIFVVAISEYNQVLMEDGQTNRMEESLKLFESIVNNAFFVQTSFILFLNKEDLFDQKIKHFPLSDYCPRFNSQLTSDGSAAAKKFITEEYLSKVRKKEGKKEKKLYHHLTCATDTNQIKVIFEDVVKIIIEKSLEKFKLQ